MGRVDDVLNVSGHRLSTMEVESALVAHDKVAEAAVVGRPDDIKGQAISAFVTLEQGVKPTEELKEELKKWVAKEIGSLAKPDDIRFTDMLPKTRSGKIMRRVLKACHQRRCEGRHHHAGGFRRDRAVERTGRSLSASSQFPVLSSQRESGSDSESALQEGEAFLRPATLVPTLPRLRGAAAVVAEGRPRPIPEICCGKVPPGCPRSRAQTTLAGRGRRSVPGRLVQP